MNRLTSGDKHLSREGHWAAGLFEGEGSIVFPLDRYIKLQLGSTDRDVVERFMEVVGCGWITENAPSSLGTKTMHVWTITDSRKIAVVLRAFLPCFGARRRERASKALDIAKEIKLGMRRITGGKPGSHYFRHREKIKARTRAYYYANRDAILARRRVARRAA